MSCQAQKEDVFTSGSFMVTEKCNLACKYCFEVGKSKCKTDMSEETILKGLKFLYDNAVYHGKNDVHVMLFGGEPLLRPDLCEFLLEEGLKLQKEWNITFSPNIITNATLLDDNVEKMLRRQVAKNRRFSCQLSIDGDKESQDLYRVYPCGKGSFDVVEKNIEKFIDVFHSNVTFHGCINKQTMPKLFDNYLYFSKFAGKIWYMPVHTEEWTEEDANIYDKQLGKILEHETKELNTVSKYSPIDKLLSTDLGCDCHWGHTCGAGTSFISFSADGSMWPCHNIYFNNPDKSEYLGNILNNDIPDEKVLSRYKKCSPKSLGCSECKNTQCYRCIADNFAVNNDINKQVGQGEIRCKLSDVERKWQLRAKEYAIEHYSPKFSDEKIQVIYNRLDSIEKMLFEHGSDIKDIAKVKDSVENMLSIITTLNA